MDDDFEWNEAKAAEDDAKHGVCFAAAIEVFKDPFAIERLDDRMNYSEDRYIVMGMIDRARR